MARVYPAFSDTRPTWSSLNKDFIIKIVIIFLWAGSLVIVGVGVHFGFKNTGSNAATTQNLPPSVIPVIVPTTLPSNEPSILTVKPTTQPVTNNPTTQTLANTQPITTTIQTVFDCTCSYGQPKMNGCPEPNLVNCETCEAGYHLDLYNSTLSYTKCVKNVCACSNGSGRVTDENLSEICEHHQMQEFEDCKSCNVNENFTLEPDNNTCAANTCFCNNGTEVSQQHCHTNNNHICQSCDTDFFLNTTTSTCQPVGCTCWNGVASENSTCQDSNNGKEFCESCNTGFVLDMVNKTCMADFDFGLGLFNSNYEGYEKFQFKDSN